MPHVSLPFQPVAQVTGVGSLEAAEGAACSRSVAACQGGHPASASQPRHYPADAVAKVERFVEAIKKVQEGSGGCTRTIRCGAMVWGWTSRCQCNSPLCQGVEKWLNLKNCEFRNALEFGSPNVKELHSWLHCVKELGHKKRTH